MAMGRPSIAPASPLARRASDAAAISNARSGVSVMKALSDRAASTAAICASVSSRDETSPRARRSRAPARVSPVRPLIIR